MTTSASLIVSPKAGDGKALRRLATILDALRAKGVEATAEVTKSLDHAAMLATDAAKAGRVAVAVGGDGLVGRVAAAASEAGGVMAIIPSGTGNDFARALHITDRAMAIEALASGNERTVDMGIAGTRRFTCIASFGFDSVVLETANASRFVRGRLVYPYATLRSLRTWKPACFTIDIDGEVHELRGYNVAVANAGFYGGGMLIAPGASLDDGLLDVVAITELSRLRFLANAPRVFRGTHVDVPGVRTWKARSVRLAVDRPFDVVADGESVAPAPLKIEILPAALRVCAGTLS